MNVLNLNLQLLTVSINDEQKGRVILPFLDIAVVYREVCTEGSEPAKSGTDEQKGHKSHLKGDKRPQQRDVQRLPKLLDVDAPQIG